MLKFIRNTFGFLVLFLFVFEILAGLTSPVFNLRQFALDVKRSIISNKKGDSFFDPDGNKITITRNNIGFISHIDFNLDSLKGNIALIGDSFINSRSCGVENSIASLLDQMIDAKVYNFGKAGANIHRYHEIYDSYNLEQLDKVFILITGVNDIMYKKANFKESGSFLKIINLIKQRKQGTQLYDKPNYNLIRNNSKNIVYVLHNNISINGAHKNDVTAEMIELDIAPKHKYLDGHYKRSGNMIIAEKIKNFLNK